MLDNIVMQMRKVNCEKGCKIRSIHIRSNVSLSPLAPAHTYKATCPIDV